MRLLYTALLPLENRIINIGAMPDKSASYIYRVSEETGYTLSLITL